MIKLLPLLFIFVSCQDINSNSSDKLLYGPSNLTGSTQFRAAFPIIQNRCANCHTSNIHDPWSGYMNEQDWADQGLVVFGDTANSKFITRIINYGGGDSNMPEGLGALPDAEYDTLLEWVENIPP